MDGITRDKLSANPTVGMPRVAGSTDKSKWAASDPVSPVQCPAISVTDDVRGWPVVALHALVDICQFVAHHSMHGMGGVAAEPLTRLRLLVGSLRVNGTPCDRVLVHVLVGVFLQAGPSHLCSLSAWQVRKTYVCLQCEYWTRTWTKEGIGIGLVWHRIT